MNCGTKQKAVLLMLIKSFDLFFSIVIKTISKWYTSIYLFSQIYEKFSLST